MEMVVFEPWVQNTLKSIECNMPDLRDLDLRDLFAMNALNGILAQGDYHGSEQQYAEQAYGFADAMIAARKIKKNKEVK